MKVCILGEGLSSLILAKALVNQNIYVDVLSRKKNIVFNKTRTIGISKSNINFINNDIIDIERYIWKLKKIKIYTDNLKDEKLLDFKDNNDQLFSIIRNIDLYSILKRSLSKNKYFRKKITNDKDLSFINKYEIIINCDYLHAVTTKFFNKKIVKKYNNFAYTSVITHQKISNDEAVQIFTKKGPLAFLPISTTQTSIVFSANQIINKKDVNLQELIKAYNFKYKIKKIENYEKFELTFLNLRSYRHKNILAFGDLLHRIHPLAGQGFNMTIRDTKTLVDIIKNKKDLGLQLDSSINIEFENISKHKNFIFSNGIDLIYELFNLERKLKNKILSRSIQFLGKNPSLNKVFAKIADRGNLF